MNDTPLRRRLGLDQPTSAESQPAQPSPYQQRPERWEPPTGDPLAPAAAAPTYRPPEWRADWDQLLNSDPARVSPRTMRVAVKELLETAVYILLVFVIVRSLVQNFKIEGSSMEPSLHSGQYILVNKLVYFHFDLNAPLRLLPGYEELPQRVVYPIQFPQRGDVIVFEYPREPQKDFIKRVIGLPGETVAIREGKVYVDEQLLDEGYLEGAPTFCSSGTTCSREPVTVPAGTVFVMGDNRANSSDSREWNALPLDRIIGQAWMLYYPIDDWGVIPHPSYAADEPNEPDAPNE